MDRLIHLILVFAAPPLMLGIINRTKALMGGRTGPPIWQPYFELARLWRKGSVFSNTVTWVFLAGPVVGLATTLLATLLIPLGNHSSVLHFEGDMLLFVYLLALGRFFLTAAALDTGSAFEGMGSAREISYGVLTEPAIFFGLLVLAQLSGSRELDQMLGVAQVGDWKFGAAAVVLVLASWFIVLLAENSRIPIDDPNTHLELTMIHEVMVLDHSGPAFGVILYTKALKLFIFAAIIEHLAVPWHLGYSIFEWLEFLLVMAAIAVLVGFVESIMARVRLLHIPNLLVTACMMSAFSILLLVSS